MISAQQQAYTWGNIYKEAGGECHVNLHQMRMIRIKSMAPNGAYCRSMALKLMLRAALRYFSDSVRRDVDKCDIPGDKKYMINAWRLETTPETHTVK